MRSQEPPPLQMISCVLASAIPSTALVQVCSGGGQGQEVQQGFAGDSGGGLMVRDQEYRWSIIGIVSTGSVECGLTPVLYHNVSSSADWIRQITQSAGA